jgi:uncharacterized protein (TIGR03067 family)
MRPALCAVLVLGLAVAADDKADPKKELKALEGTWQVTKMEVAGQDATDKAPKSFKVVGEKLTGLGPEMAITLDPSKTPRHIDLTFERDGKKFPVKAAYELAKDELTLAIPMATTGKAFENKRPEKLASGTADDPVMLVKAERAR